MKNSIEAIKIFSTLSIITAGLAGCTATTSISQQSPSSTPELVRAKVPENNFTKTNMLVLTGLTDSSLPRGKCGMVLWTLDENRPVPVLRYVAENNGEFRLNQIPYELIRVEVGGNSAYGVFPQQVFAAGSDIRVSVNVRFGQGFEGGAYLDGGILKIEKPGQSTLVTPVAGIAGCRAQ